MKIYHSKKETFREIPKEMSMITARYVRLKKEGLETQSHYTAFVCLYCVAQVPRQRALDI